MQHNKTTVNALILTVLGFTPTIQPASAQVLDGSYDLVVITTPTTYISGLGTIPVFGSDGNWNSSFTFGNLPGLSVSRPMTDTGTGVTGSDGITRGSGIAGDGFAGILRINVSGSNVTVSSFSKDTVFGTAGGNFAQYVSSPTVAGDTSNMSGTINQSSNAMTLQPTGRYGAISSPNGLYDKKWNIDNYNNASNTAYGAFTTASITNANGTINGTPLSNIGDVNGDNINDYAGVLVSGGAIGSDWGSFFGAQYFEAWKIRLLSAFALARDDSATVSEFTSKQINVLTNDGGQPPLIVASKTDGTVGTVAIDAGGASVTYTSTGGAGPDSFTYTMTDNNGNSSTATVNVTLTTSPVTAGDDAENANQGNQLTAIAVASLTANDSTSVPGQTIDDATLSPTSPTSSQGGTVTLNASNIEYMPPSVDYLGTDTFAYTVEDTAGNISNEATVTITLISYGFADIGNYGPGSIAQGVTPFNGRISVDDVPPDDGASASCVGGCFDFIVTVAGNPTTVVLPTLGAGITDGLSMRKLIGGSWKDFDTTTGDSLASAPLTINGGCPPIADGSWAPLNGAMTTVTNTGHVCLKMTIADDGPNDSNATPGVIADPSGLAIPVDNAPPAGQDLLNDFKNNGGCSLSSSNGSATEFRGDWVLVAAFLGILGWLRRKTRT